jgi:hypothetical protein
LDQRNFEDCAGREDSFVNLLDGQHSFVVFVNTSNGVQFSAQYNWTVGMWYLQLDITLPSLCFTTKAKKTTGLFLSANQSFWNVMRSQLTLISMNYVFGALVDASGRAELYGTTDRSIGLYEPD